MLRTGKYPDTTSSEWVIHYMRAAIEDIEYCASSGRQLVAELNEIYRGSNRLKNQKWLRS